MTLHIPEEFSTRLIDWRAGGGSDEDPFEHRQVDLAQERLGKLGLQIERLPGGYLTTNEQPEALAALIAKFERGHVIITE